MMKGTDCMWRYALWFLAPLLPVILASGCSWTPLQVAIWPPVQLAPKDADVYGVRVDVPYGSNANLYGVDAGVLNTIGRGNLNDLQKLEGRVVGIQAGLLNAAGGMWGIQGGAFNAVGDMKGISYGAFLDDAGKVQGAQLSGFGFWLGWNQAREIQGIQVAGMNMSAKVEGMQVGLAQDGGRVTGGQVGAINAATEVRGGQVGAINLSRELAGLEIGAVNVVGPTGGKAKGGCRVRGVQLGLCNYAQEMAGVQLGVLNVIPKGPIPFFPLINVGWIRSPAPEPQERGRGKPSRIDRSQGSSLSP